MPIGFSRRAPVADAHVICGQSVVACSSGAQKALQLGFFSPIRSIILLGWLNSSYQTKFPNLPFALDLKQAKKTFFGHELNNGKRNKKPFFEQNIRKFNILTSSKQDWRNKWMKDTCQSTNRSSSLSLQLPNFHNGKNKW